MNHESVLSSRLGLFSAKLIPQQQNAMGSLRNIDFGAFWASRGGSGKELGSGNRLSSMSSDSVRRFRRSMSSDGLGSVPEVWTEPALGTGFWEPEVLRRFRVPEILLPRFQKLLCTLKIYICTLPQCLLQVAMKINTARAKKRRQSMSTL